MTSIRIWHVLIVFWAGMDEILAQSMDWLSAETLPETHQGGVSAWFPSGKKQSPVMGLSMIVYDL